MSRRKRLTIDRLEMVNFKRFYGRTVIELATDPDGKRSIILIGAENGRGKTSIHEAIMSVFYGERTYPGIRGRDHYFKMVSDRLNRKAVDEGQSDFLVAMELTIDEPDASKKYRLERRWELDSRSRRAVNYTLSITEDGVPLKAVNADDTSETLFEDFVRSLIPPEVSPFFLFDGEQIQQYAEKGFFGEEMGEAIRNILDIKIYQLLREDLKKNVIEFLGRTEIRDDVRSELFEIKQDAHRLESECERRRVRLKELGEEVEEIQRKKQFAAEELVILAGPHQSERQALIAEQQRLETAESEATRDIEKAFEELPLILPAALGQQLYDRLESEGQLMATPEHVQEMRRRVGELEGRLQQDLTGGSWKQGNCLPIEQAAELCQHVHEIAFDVFELHAGAPQSRLHDIGEGQRRALLLRLQEVKRCRFLLAEAMTRRENASVDRRSVEAKLASTTDDPEAIALMSKQEELSRLLGQREQEEKTIRAELAKFESDLAKRQGQIEHRERSYEKQGEARQVVQFASSIREALQEFIHRLSVKKLESVEHAFTKMYSSLRKAEDPWHAVEVDRETYEVVLKDQQGRRLERSVFSAGMKEMYALSLIWALGQSCGRQLPIVIDTPMGRLDRRNREALFEKYLPQAGHQVIVLSTDTEVDVEWARRLEPHVARQYHLDWEPSTEGTVVRAGYFY